MHVWRIVLKRAEALVNIEPRRNGETLQGALSSCSSERGITIAPPHPLYGGSMESPVVKQLAEASRSLDISSLRFDWRGIGGSSGTPSGETADADLDFGAAMDLISKVVSGGIVASGYSFGSLAALRAASHPRVGGLILVAPPAEYLAEHVLRSLGKPVLLISGEYDEIAPPRKLQLLDDGRSIQLNVIKNADHFFGKGLTEIGTEASIWLTGLFQK